MKVIAISFSENVEEHFASEAIFLYIIITQAKVDPKHGQLRRNNLPPSTKSD